MKAGDISIQRAFEFFEGGCYKDSRDLCVRLLRKGPPNAEAHQLAAAACIQLNKINAAARHLEHAARLSPNDARFSTALADVYLTIGRTSRALESARRAYQIAPDDVRTAIVYSKASLAANLHRQTIELLKDRIAEFPRPIRRLLARAYAKEGYNLVAQRKYLDAVDAYQQSLELDDAPAVVLSNLGYAYTFCGSYSDAESCFRRAIDSDPTYLGARSNLLMHMHYSSQWSPAEIAKEHRRQGRAWDQHSRVVSWNPKRYAVKKLRIGYVSGDFRQHPVSKFVEPILAHHDRERFDVYCYYNAPICDRVTGRLRGLADQWRSIFGLDDEEAVKQIRADACDILVDLGGHTHGNRLGVFGRRAAPVQATYLGYPDLTGLTEMQYWITDSTCRPPEPDDLYGSERVVRIDECFLCYRPDANAPRVGPLPFDTIGRFTFGSLNQYPKLSHETIKLWAKILHAVPVAGLLLGSRALDDLRIRELTRERFTAEGIDPSRLELLGYIRPQRNHLKTYNRIDVALDPFPFNGATTTCEALWMGTPVITLKGKVHVSRMGASLLNASRLPEFVADTQDEYLHKAVAVAANLDELREMRSSLRARLSRSVLCDQPRFARCFERALWAMWADSHGEATRSSPKT